MTLTTWVSYHLPASTAAPTAAAATTAAPRLAPVTPERGASSHSLHAATPPADYSPEKPTKAKPARRAPGPPAASAEGAATHDGHPSIISANDPPYMHGEMTRPNSEGDAKAIAQSFDLTFSHTEVLRAFAKTRTMADANGTWLLRLHDPTQSRSEVHSSTSLPLSRFLPLSHSFLSFSFEFHLLDS